MTKEEFVKKVEKGLLSGVRTPDNLIRKEEERTLINIPENGEYIEIMGHKITGDFNSFESFVEYLKHVAEVEKENEALKEEIRKKDIEKERFIEYLEIKYEESKLNRTYVNSSICFTSIQEQIYREILYRVKGDKSEN